MGIGDTYTVAHKDSSASTGFNLMVHASSTLNPDDMMTLQDSGAELSSILDNGEASAFWFLSSAEDSEHASRYLDAKWNSYIDFEAHYAMPNDFAEMGCPVSHLKLCSHCGPIYLIRRSLRQIYVCQQKLGDLVLVPRKSCHQVSSSIYANYISSPTDRSPACPTRSLIMVVSISKLHGLVCRSEV